MAKVSDMIGDAAEPRGNLGYAVDHDTATRIASDMRAIMDADRDELLIAAAAYTYNIQCDHEELIAAWEFLNPRERRAWREFVRLGKC
jgi:hypothetical protein